MMEDLSNHQFQAVVQLPTVADELSFLLLEDGLASEVEKKTDSAPNRTQYRESIRNSLMFIDKKLFLKLRAGELTLDQVDARINKANFGVSYKVLDDLRDGLNPDILREGLNSEEHLKRLYNKKADETVTVEEILEPK